MDGACPRAISDVQGESSRYSIRETKSGMARIDCVDSMQLTRSAHTWRTGRQITNYSIKFLFKEYKYLFALASYCMVAHNYRLIYDN